MLTAATMLLRNALGEAETGAILLRGRAQEPGTGSELTSLRAQENTNER